MSEEMQAEGTQTLGKLISWLEKQDPNLIVKHGFESGHSDRGNYCNVAFSPIEETAIGEMLKHAKLILDTKQTGWKGGTFTMNEYVEAHIGHYGECGEPITTYNYRYWLESSLNIKE